MSIANTGAIVGEVLHLERIEAAGNTQSRSRRRAVVQAVRTASGLALASSLLAIAGCGNNYRPVVSAISPVGPAAQPGKYAVVASSPSPTAPGLITFVDFSGDTVVITANIGVNPYYLVLNGGSAVGTQGTTGYTLNSDDTLTSFSISPSLLSSQVLQTTLLSSNNNPSNTTVLPVSILPQNSFTYVTQPNNNPGLAPTTPPAGRNSIAEFQSSPLNLQQELPISPAFSPIYVTGNAASPRSFVLSQAINGGAGQVNTIENTATPTIDPNPIPVGKNPVYGVTSADNRRAFILNQGDGTVSVINAQANALDVVPAGATNPIQVGTGPIWADFAPTRNELVVANSGDGVHAGSVSIINIPLCTATALPNNPNCDPNNPIDAVGFGQVLANIPVGINPVMVGVLQDGTQAYVVNQGDLSQPCAVPSTAQPLGNCTVSVINLNTNTVIATIPIPTTGVPGVKNGHPNYIAVTTGAPTGKVYVTSPESTFMTVIRTDTDAVTTTIPLQGNGVSVRVTVP